MMGGGRKGWLSSDTVRSRPARPLARQDDAIER